MKKIKTNKKMVTIIVIIIALLFSSIIGVYAERIIASSKVTYNNSTSGLTSTNVQGAVDELYAKCIGDKSEKVYLSKYLRTLVLSSTIIQDDETSDHNMRYIGPNPNNYVSFNGELWRIIGVFNSNSHGRNEELVKIQYTKSLGMIKWDDTNVNNWARPATLNTYLNEGEYYTSKLNATAKSMIQEVTWKIGGAPWAVETMYPSVFYNYERGTTVYSGRPTEWTGNVALAYPSDYLYSTTGGSTYNRDTCFSKPARNVDNTANPYWSTDGANVGDCAAGSWMIQQARTLADHPWTLTSRSDNANCLFAAHSSYLPGTFGFPGANSTNRGTVPVVYLKSNIICTNCGSSEAGTQSNPYKLSIG